MDDFERFRQQYLRQRAVENSDADTRKANAAKRCRELATQHLPHWQRLVKMLAGQRFRVVSFSGSYYKPMFGEERISWGITGDRSCGPHGLSEFLTKEVMSELVRLHRTTHIDAFFQYSWAVRTALGEPFIVKVDGSLSVFIQI